MKLNMKSRIGFMAALASALSVGAGYVLVPRDKVYIHDEAKPQTKSGGGRGGAVRIYTSEAYAWRKVFRGLAIHPFSDLSGCARTKHESSARGPRPDTFFKRQRAKLHLSQNVTKSDDASY